LGFLFIQVSQLSSFALLINAFHNFAILRKAKELLAKISTTRKFRVYLRV
jgi:hypothetical protein